MNRKLILQFPRFVPLGAITDQLEAKSDIPVSHLDLDDSLGDVTFSFLFLLVFQLDDHLTDLLGLRHVQIPVEQQATTDWSKSCQ